MRYFSLNLHSLRTRLILLFSILLILLIIGIGVAGLAFIGISERTTWEGRQDEAAQSAAARVAAFMVQTLNSLKMIALLSPDYLQADPRILDELLRENPALLEVSRLDQQGHLLATAVQDDQPLLDNFFTTPQANWFHQARDGKIYIGTVQLSPTAEPYLFLALPAHDQGVVVARLQLNLLWEVVGEIRFGESGAAYVVDQNERIVAHPTPQVVIEQMKLDPNSALSNAIKQNNYEQRESYVNFLGEPVVGVVHKIADTNWFIVTEIQQTEANAQLRIATVLFLVIAIIVILLALWATLRLLNNTVLRPLVTLQAGAERVGQGNLTQHIPIARADEIGNVTQAFNAMMQQLFVHEQQLATQNRALEAEITEHRRTTSALQQSEQVNRAILSAIPDALFRLGSDGTILDHQSSPHVHFFLSPAEFLGKRLAEVLPDSTGGDATTAIQQILATGATQTFEFELPLGQETRDYEARLVVIGQAECLAIVRDITERKRQEELLRANLATERRLSEMKSNFISLMSHEFRTPLSIILTSNDLLQRAAAKLPAEAKERYFGNIRGQVYRLTQILEDILIVSQATTTGLTLELLRVNLEEFCRTIFEEVQAQTPEHTIRFVATQANRTANVDHKLLRQAITSLLSNAVKYSPAGSTIHFELFCNGSEATIQVRDQGIGIPLEDQKDLFTPFHRAQNIDYRGGIGLGLAIVKQTVEQHGGTITFESQESVGSTFSIKLPLA